MSQHVIQKVTGSKIGGRVIQSSDEVSATQIVENTSIERDLTQQQRPQTPTQTPEKISLNGVGEATGGKAVLILGIVAIFSIIASIVYYATTR